MLFLVFPLIGFIETFSMLQFCITKTKPFVLQLLLGLTLFGVKMTVLSVLQLNMM